MPHMKYFFTAFLMFFLPIYGLLLAVGIVIALDTFTGVYKSVKIGGWKNFSSKKLSDVVGKFILYQVAVISVFVIDKTLLGEFFKIWFSIPFFFTKIVTIVLVFIELVSIKENIEAAFKIDIIELIKNVLRRTKEIKDDVNQIID